LANGTIQALPPGTVVAWSSDTTTVATVDPNSGVALGVAAGTANITASSAGLNPGTAVLRVQAATARFAYVADAQGQVGTSFPGTISGYSVDVTSATPLTPLLNTPVVPASTPQQVLLHPSGDLMYYLDSAGFLHIDDITAADGSFADSKQNPVQASTSNQSTNVGVIDPTGRFIYVISSIDNSIYGFKITQTADKAPLTNGALSDVSPTFNPYTDATLNNPTWIMTDRAGKYVYVVNNGNDTISKVFAFNLDSTGGVIGSQIGTPLMTGNSPNGMAIDPTGVLLAIDNNFDNTLSLFTIAPSGSTTPPPGGITATTPPTVATDNQPLFVVFYTAASGQ